MHVPPSCADHVSFSAGCVCCQELDSAMLRDRISELEQREAPFPTPPGQVPLNFTLAHLQLIHQGLVIIGEQNRVDFKLVETWRGLLRDVGTAVEVLLSTRDGGDGGGD